MADDRYVFEDPRFGPQGKVTRDREESDSREEASYELAPPERRGCMRSCFTGCLWIGLVLLIIGGVAAYFVAKNWRKWAADLGSQIAEESLDATDLPPAEKAEIGVEIDRLAEAFAAGRISLEQAQDIVRLLAESPLATSIIVAVVDSKYLASSGLNDVEKEEGRRQLRRFARGIIENKIPEASRNATLQHMADRQPDGSWRLRQRVSDDDLRAFLASAKSDADAAQIAEEPEVVDPSDELRQIVDEALGAPLMQPEAAPAP